MKNDRGIFFSLSFLFFLQKNKNDVDRFPCGSNWSAMFCMWVYYNEKWARYFTCISGSHESNFWKKYLLIRKFDIKQDMSQLLDTEVSAIQWSPLFRGVRYSEVSAIRRCPLFRGVRYSEVSAIQRCPLFRGVRYSVASAIQWRPLFSGVRHSVASAIQRCPLFRGFH